jgi:hypothetical protein
MEFIPLLCPMCGHSVGRAANESGVSYAEYRCRNRRCAAQPVITFRLADGRASPYALVDRSQRRRVS